MALDSLDPLSCSILRFPSFHFLCTYFNAHVRVCICLGFCSSQFSVILQTSIAYANDWKFHCRVLFLCYFFWTIGIIRVCDRESICETHHNLLKFTRVRIKGVSAGFRAGVHDILKDYVTKDEPRYQLIMIIYLFCWILTKKQDFLVGR